MECANCHKDKKQVDTHIPCVEGVVCQNCRRNWRKANEPGYHDRVTGLSASWQHDHHDRCVVNRTKWAKDHPDKIAAFNRKFWLKKRYGITQEQYEAILAAQGGGCAICGTKDPGKGRKNFCVDHDHKTGKVRGLLCAKHNKMLGLAGDDVELLERSIDYLQGS